MLAGGAEVSVKIVAGIAAVLAVICAAGFSALAAGSRAVSVSRNMVVVTTTADVVNGNTSSIAALNRKPGRDGISLREALLAADHTGGSATVYILFSARLNGKTIAIRSELPPIHRDHMVVEGIAPNGASARVTIDGRRARLTPPGMSGGELLLVQASEVTVRWLSFTSARTQLGGLDVIPGQNNSAPPSIGPLKIANVQILDNVFTSTGGAAEGVFIGNAYFANTHVSGVTIARNTFLVPSGVGGEGVLVATDGAGATTQGVVIENNTFDGNEWGIELGEKGNAPRQEGTQIINNTITGGTGTIGITLDSSATNGTIDGTVIDGNAISGGQEPALILDAEAYDPHIGGTSGSDVISNTQIINNVISSNVTSGIAGIYMAGGNTTSSPPSRVSTVTIENDTFVNEQQGFLFAASPGAPGNLITDITIRNSILYEPSGFPPISETGPTPPHLPDVVTNSLISGAGWAGTNGNINGDPLFVNAPGGDYHLTAGSPAVNAGTPIGAPSDDIAGAPRDAQPDIGAFEFGATPRPLLTVTTEALGGSGVVTGSPAGINCGTVCSARFDPSTTVTLTAKPDRGSKFLGWSQPCSGKTRCTVSLTSAQSVTARFAP